MLPHGAIPAVVCMMLCACSRFPPPPDKPDIDPDVAGQAAIDEFDADKDGKLDAEELKACPPLQVAFQRIDSDGDGGLTAEEIAARIRGWLNSGTTIIEGATDVTLDGKPLTDATVTFDPPKFLGPGFKACGSQTNSIGRACVTGADAKYPGIYLGLYHVRISKQVGGQETIPARYNSQSELAFEAASDAPVETGIVEFHLKSQ